MNTFAGQFTNFKDQEEKCLRGIWIMVPAETKAFIYENADVELNGSYTTACALCYVIGKVCGKGGCQFRFTGIRQ